MTPFARGLKCRLCGKTYPKQALNFCTDDFGPLEVDYDYDAIGEASAAPRSSCGPSTCGAIANCCPSTASRPSGTQVGGTPLVEADRLADGSGRREARGSRTTPSTSRRCRSRTASSPWP